MYDMDRRGIPHSIVPIEKQLITTRRAQDGANALKPNFTRMESVAQAAPGDVVAQLSVCTDAETKKQGLSAKMQEDQTRRQEMLALTV